MLQTNHSMNTKQRRINSWSKLLSWDYRRCPTKQCCSSCICSCCSINAVYCLSVCALNCHIENWNVRPLDRFTGWPLVSSTGAFWEPLNTECHDYWQNSHHELSKLLLFTIFNTARTIATKLSETLDSRRLCKSCTSLRQRIRISWTFQFLLRHTRIFRNVEMPTNFNKSSRSNLGRGPRRGAVAHVRRKVFIGYNGAPQIRPLKYPFPWTDLQTTLPASSLDPSDLWCQTASRSDPSFCHNALDRPTDARMDRQIVHGKVWRL